MTQFEIFCTHVCNAPYIGIISQTRKLKVLNWEDMFRVSVYSLYLILICKFKKDIGLSLDIETETEKVLESKVSVLDSTTRLTISL